MRWLPDFFNDLGFGVTLLGFMITIWQILMLKSRQKEIAFATKRAVGRLQTVDHAISISIAREAIYGYKMLAIKGELSLLGQRIPDLKEELYHCRTLCPEQTKNIDQLLDAFRDYQENINQSLINPDDPTFKPVKFCSTLDQTREVFAEAINKCKK
jgi:hypothetical protein